MRFSSIAVSLLAQSVPLLAVGHLVGWKKREERFWLQNRRFRDALLMGVQDRKGLLFEKHVRVHGKHDDVLEKKRLGSARIVQHRASRDVFSDDRESSVECDPLSKVTDSGIFGCGMDSYCVRSEESKLGGFCVSSKQAPSINRALQGNGTCVETDRSGHTCDCSEFDNTNSVGNITCSGPYCYGTVCWNFTYSASKDVDGSYAYEICRELNTTLMGLENYCFSVSSVGNSAECEIKANGDVCNSCEFHQSTCPSHPITKSSPFDCTNTVLNSEGEHMYPYPPFWDLVVSSETGAPTATPMPGTACLETDPWGFTCDCSEFDNTNSVGNITCGGPYCWGTACGNYTYSASKGADGSFAYEKCAVNITLMGVESYCGSVNSDGNSTECEIKANGVVCNSCDYLQSTCPSWPNLKTNIFDCTNTVFNSKGDECTNGGPFFDIVVASMNSETGAPSATSVPSSETDAPSATSVPSSETGAPSATSVPRTETSSGSSHAANIVVSAAAAAWMASLGT